MVIITQPNKTNAFETTGWRVTETPYPAIRGEGSGHSAFFPFVQGALNPELWVKEGTFQDPTPSKIIKTKKGNWLLVPCTETEKENILFLHLVGGFRGGVHPTGGIWGVEGKPFALKGKTELLYCVNSDEHCSPSLHAVVRCSEDAICRFDWCGHYGGGTYLVSGDGTIISIPEDEIGAYIKLNFPEYGVQEMKALAEYLAD